MMEEDAKLISKSRTAIDSDHSATSAPWSALLIARARPNPRPAPVMTTHRPNKD
jgi:hypothetical protein